MAYIIVYFQLKINFSQKSVPTLGGGGGGGGG